MEGSQMDVGFSVSQRVVTPIRNVLRGRFYYGWVIVAIGFVGDFLAAGIGGYTLGLFFRTMGAELGWSRTTLAFSQTVRSVVTGLSGPLIGPMVDRFGARVIMVMGALVAGVSLIGLSRISEPWHFYLLYGAGAALGIAEFGNLVIATAVAKWFVRKRGRAMAFTTMGVSSGGLVLVPVTSFIISSYGWRTAWVFFGVLVVLLITLPAGLFMRSTPESMGLRPDGDPNPPRAAISGEGRPTVAAASQEHSWTLGEAVRTRAFWLLVVGFNVGSVALTAMLLHQIPYIQDKGFSQTTAAAVASAFAFGALVCKLPWGFLVERVPVRYCVMAMYIGSAFGLAILIAAQSTPMLLLYAMIYGLNIGATGVLSSVAWANYFGRTFIGTIQGFVAPFQMGSTALSPLFAAWVYDTLGSYNYAVMTFIATYLLASVVLYLAKPPQRLVEAR